MPRKRQLAEGPAKTPKVEPHYHGHRERLRDRFREAGAEALADYELLELLLFRVIPKKDVKPIAKALLDKFGSFAEVIGAPHARLMEVDGVKEATATHFQLMHAAAIRMLRDPVKRRQVLTSEQRVVDYCRAAMAFAEQEQFRILFLDKRNQLIADEVQQTGTVDHTPVYPREVMRRAIQLNATGMILVHNHPSGDPSPSSADIRMTQKIIDVAREFDIAVHDHLIVGRDGHASLKGLKLI